ncbi:MAG: TonB-dependent receptor [Flavobacteriaceae bacterium]|jgi:outer membrane receptor for ferrienterochelin and colicins|nr:TonB-dependent receptor [Flavobacteriaceae bacterium]
MKDTHKITLFFSFLFLISSAIAHSQSKTDSTLIKNKEIEEVVVTGQYSPQAIDKSIYQIEVISQEDIKNRAASTIADILNYNLNFVTIPNSGTGDSEANLFGLDGQYFKVLIDNIPLVTDNAMGSRVDLTKINLDNVERIEIVRGSMGVDYGSNSLTGLINIITKKKDSSKWRISGYVQEETVGNEYDWKEKGRHIQSLSVSHNISDKWFVSVGANRNDFQGFFGSREGKRYYQNDGNRGYEWLPKEQWSADALINFKTKNFTAFYKAQYLHELVNYYNPITKYAPLEEGGLYTYSSIDRDYSTDRLMNQLFIEATLFDKINYKGDFSYQKQDRKERDYFYDIAQREVFGEKPPYKSYQETEAWYTRGTFSRFLNSKIFDFQLGYEFNFMENFRSANSTPIGGLTTSGFKGDAQRHLDTYDVFASGEIRTLSGLSLRPGFRTSFSSKFDNQYSYSLAMKYILTPDSNIRAEFASTNRTPNFEELYTYFVDVNHDVQGNEDLVPEKGYSSSIHWHWKTKPGSDFRSEINLGTLYIDLKDKIELSTINTQPLQYRYINVDKYLSWGLHMGSSFYYKNLNFTLGASYFGVSEKLEDDINGIKVITPPDEYLYTFQLNSSIHYNIPKWETTLSVYYKYNGKESNYVFNSSTDTYYLGKQDDFSMLDASIRKSLFKKAIELTLGVRNIFDVKNIDTTAAQAGAHQGPISSLNLFYGRSYFAKLGFNLNL